MMFSLRVGGLLGFTRFPVRDEESQVCWCDSGAYAWGAASQEGDLARRQRQALLPHREQVFHMHGNDSAQLQALKGDRGMTVSHPQGCGIAARNMEMDI